MSKVGTVAKNHSPDWLSISVIVETEVMFITALKKKRKVDVILDEMQINKWIFSFLVFDWRTRVLP